jgi:hypothetical protein
LSSRRAGKLSLPQPVDSQLLLLAAISMQAGEAPNSAARAAVGRIPPPPPPPSPLTPWRRLQTTATSSMHSTEADKAGHSGVPGTSVETHKLEVSC